MKAVYFFLLLIGFAIFFGLKALGIFIVILVVLIIGAAIYGIMQGITENKEQKKKEEQIIIEEKERLENLRKTLPMDQLISSTEITFFIDDFENVECHYFSNIAGTGLRYLKLFSSYDPLNFVGISYFIASDKRTVCLEVYYSNSDSISLATNDYIILQLEDGTNHRFEFGLTSSKGWPISNFSTIDLETLLKFSTISLKKWKLVSLRKSNSDVGDLSAFPEEEFNVITYKNKAQTQELLRFLAYETLKKVKELNNF